MIALKVSGDSTNIKRYQSNYSNILYVIGARLKPNTACKFLTKSLSHDNQRYYSNYFDWAKST